MNLDKFRLALIMLCAIFSSWPIIAVSQQREAGYSQLLSFPSITLRLDSLSNWITRESGFVLSFNAGKINPDKKILLSGTTVKLNELLSYLDQHYQLANKMIGNHIILYNRDLFIKKAAGASIKQKQHPTHEKRIPVKKSTAASKVSVKHSELDTPPIRPITRSRQSFNFVRPKLPKETGISLMKQILVPDDIAKQNDIHEIHPGQGNNRFYASAGLTADETLYVNTQVKAGLPWLFVTGAWGTSFRASGFFYGPGTSIRLSMNWGFQLSALTGVLFKDFDLPAIDTMGALHVKSRLTRINLTMKKQMSNRWTLQFGPVINFMKSNYYINNKTTGASSSLPPGTIKVDKNYDLLRPLYTLSESYDEQAASGKNTWIGFQIGLFYRIW